MKTTVIFWVTVVIKSVRFIENKIIERYENQIIYIVAGCIYNFNDQL